MTQIFNNMNISNQTPVPSSNSTQVSIPVQTAIPATKVNGDKVELSQPKEKVSIFKKISRGISNIKKSFVSFGEHTKGVLKGVYNGAIAGSVVYTVGQVVNHFKKGPKKIHNVFLASIAAAGVLAGNVWNGHLNANEKMSDIDHRWTGHQ